MTQNSKTLLVGAGCGLAGLFLGATMFGGGGGESSKSTPEPALANLEASIAGPATTPAATAAPAEPQPTSDWRISERTDPMTDETVKSACVNSSNQVYLSPPYGPRGAQLCIRQHPEFGRDVYLTLTDSGQILCRSYDGCTIPIRFDDGAVQQFSGNEPSDNSSETVFIANDGRFIQAAKGASRIRVQLEFYQNGNQTFDFPARGLEW